MYLIGTQMIRNGSFSEQYSAHVHDDGGLMVEVGEAGNVTDTHFLVVPASALPWLADMVAKAARAVVTDAPARRPARRFAVFEGGRQFPHVYSGVQTPNDLPMRPGGGGSR